MRACLYLLLKKREILASKPKPLVLFLEANYKLGSFKKLSNCLKETPPKKKNRDFWKV